MKRTLLIAATLLAAYGVYAQGRVNFANNASPAGSLITTGGSVMSGAANSYKFQLLWAADQTSTFVPAITSGTNMVNFNSALLGAGRIGNRNSLALDGQAAGNWIMVQVRGWSMNLGSTWEQAVAAAATWTGPATAYMGISGVGRVQLATTTANGPTIFVGGATPAEGTIQLANFELAAVPIVPEPSTLALVGLGLAGLVFIRRRK